MNIQVDEVVSDDISGPGAASRSLAAALVDETDKVQSVIEIVKWYAGGNPQNIEASIESRDLPVALTVAFLEGVFGEK